MGKMSMIFAIVIFAVVLIAGTFAQRAFLQRMRRFYDRRCTGRAWRDRFPEAKEEEIRGFLELFVESFALSRKRKLSFLPDDKIMDVYRAINPQIGGADALECETLVAECEARYGVDINRGFSDSTTLGDLFRSVHEKAHPAGTDTSGASPSIP
jgi:propanediol dehydratase small subunit